MKKIIIKIAIFSFLALGFGYLGTNYSFASLPSNVTITLDRVVESMCDQRSYLSVSEKREKYTQVVDFLGKIEGRLNTSQRAVASYIQPAFSQKLADLATGGTNGDDVYTIPNVDMSEVRKAWLDWHNAARAAKWLPALQWDTALEGTAHNWSTYLASINASTHKRKSTDGYYNYNSIQEWFAEQGVYFLDGPGSSFTENIAYQYYSCSKSDCTQDMINAIKKGFDFFMSEASRNGPHYRGVMSQYFTHMGAGIAIVGKRYYIVTHYGRR